MVAVGRDPQPAPLESAPRPRLAPLVVATADHGDHDAGVRADLAVIAARLGQALTIPERPFTADEEQTIALLRSVLHTGRATRIWFDLAFDMRPEFARNLLDAFAGGRVCGLGAEGPGETFELFGTALRLGPERLVFLQASLVNEREVRAQLALQPDSDVGIELRFAPGENNLVDSIFLAWLPTPGTIDTRPSAVSQANASMANGLAGVPLWLPGKWRILSTPPLRDPVELPPDPQGRQPGAWAIAVPDRVIVALDQLDGAERSAVLASLWALQRGDAGRLLKERATPLAGPGVLYMLRPASQVRVIIRQVEDAAGEVVDIVRPDTLRNLFRGR